MATADIAELVSQSEKEGVTLAEVIARDLSPQEIEDLQAALNAELAANRRNIESFMSDVSVPSIDEILGLGEFAEFQSGLPEEPEVPDEGESLVDFV
jgi:hypothetical protein